MDLWKRVLIFATFILFSCGIALISTALATDYWFSAKPVFNTSLALSAFDNQRSDEDSASSTVATLRSISLNNDISVHSGLFNGVRMLDFGLGVRSTSFTSMCFLIILKMGGHLFDVLCFSSR